MGVLRSGVVLNKQQMLVEEELLLSDEMLLARLDSAGSFFESLLQDMRAGQAFLRDRIWTRKALKAPIHSLPTEVIQDILLLACTEERYDWMGRPIHPVTMFGNHDRNVPNNFAQVCARWHHIVYNTPNFWGALTVQLPRTDAERRRLRQVLGRSGSIPIQLVIERDDWLPPCSARSASLRVALTRVRELHVDYDVAVKENIGGAVDCHFLRRLFLHVRGVHGISNLRSFSRSQLTSLIQAPLLEHFWTDCFSELARHNLFPAHTLAVFECGGRGIIQLPHLRELMRRCSLIRSLSVHIGLFEEDQNMQDPFRLDGVEYLAFNCEYSYSSLSFLDLITTPVLTELVLPVDPPDNIWTHLIDLIRRSACHLQSLSCTLPWNFNDDPSGWSSVFALLPNLATLRVQLPGSLSWTGKSALDVLCHILSGDTPRLPKLQSFQVSTHGSDWRESDREIQDTDRIVSPFLWFAEARSPGNQYLSVFPLRTARLIVRARYDWGNRSTGSISGSLAARCEVLRSAGVECVVTFSSN
ncbi:hypothetical protein V5O48_004144 [Marasmius crinis-equi]|uniref:F-box domain-containing protein n=1 Tax=Marasmius crinis-equi TaxID=585013 RepID=A0ABR3FQX6_9AGAR